MSTNESVKTSKRNDLMKNYIANCIKALMVDNTIENISVKDIIEAAEISKSTFYPHFLDKYDALSWMYYQVLKNNQAKYSDIWEQSYHNLSFLKECKEFRRAMMTKAQNSLYSYTEDFSYAQHIELAQAYYKTDDLPDLVEKSIYLYTAGSFLLSIRWLQNGAKEDVKTIIQTQKNTASDLLLEIFSIDASAAAVDERARNKK